MRTGNKMKKSALVLAVVFGIAGQANAETLQQVIEQVLRESPDILSDAAQRRATDEAVKEARAGYFPKVDLLLGAGREKTENLTTRTATGGAVSYNRREAQLTLTQMLFDGMLTPSEVDRQQARRRSAAYHVAGTSEDIALRTVEAYLDVLRNQELVALTKQNLEAHNRTFDQIKLRSQGGIGRKSDEDQMQARLSLAQANLAAAESTLHEAEIAYGRYVGTMPGDLAKPTAPEKTPKSVDEAVQQATDGNPILKSAKADADATDAQHRAAKSQLMPRLDLELGTSRNRELDGSSAGTVKDTYAMLRLRYNLFKGGGDVARVSETRELNYAAQEIARRVQRQVEQNARLSWNAYMAAQQRLPSLKQHADSSQLARDAYGKQFSLGQRTLLDLLDSENEFFTASSDYINGQYDEMRARYRMLADSGMLLDALGVKPRDEALLQ